MERAEGVGSELLLHQLVGDFLERTKLAVARAIHQHIDAAKLLTAAFTPAVTVSDLVTSSEIWR
jgi:hypothetical protein